MENYELYHHGVKGMKWGVRRTPKQLGHDVPGKKRKKQQTVRDFYNNLVKSRREKAEAKAKAKEAEAKAKAKAEAAKKREEEREANLSEQELNSRVRKLQARKQYDSLKGEAAAKSKINELRTKKANEMTDDELSTMIRHLELEQRYKTLQAQSQTKNKAKEFAQGFMKNAVTPALNEAGKELIKSAIVKAGKQALGIDDKTAKTFIKKTKQTVDKATESTKKAAEKTKEQSAKPDKSDNSSKDDSVKYYDGEVRGKGSSSGDWNTSSGREYVYESTRSSNSRPTSAEISTGKSYVSGLLENKEVRSLPASTVLALPPPRDDD